MLRAAPRTASRLNCNADKGLLGSDANFITMHSIAPEGRAEGTMNLDSDPNNPQVVGQFWEIRLMRQSLPSPTRAWWARL